MRLAAAARFLAQLESVVAKPGTEKDGDGHGGRFMWPRPLRVWKDLRPQSAFGEHSAMPEDPLDKKGLLQATKERSSHDLLQNEKSSWEGVLRNSGKQKREYKDEEQRNTVQLCDPQVDAIRIWVASASRPGMAATNKVAAWRTAPMVRLTLSEGVIPAARISVNATARCLTASLVTATSNA